MVLRIKISALVMVIGIIGASLYSNIFDDIKKGFNKEIADPFKKKIIKPSEKLFTKTIPDGVKKEVIKPAERLFTKTIPEGVKKEIINPAEKVFDDIKKYGEMAVQVINALKANKPVTGYQLTMPFLYLDKSSRQNPPTIAEERAALIKAKNDLSQEDSDLKDLYNEEIKIVDAVEKYSPIIYIHPDDLAGPIAPADFFEAKTTMVREKNKKAGDPVVIPRGLVTFKKLSDLAKENPSKQYFIWHGQEKNPLEYDKDIFYGSNPASYPDGAVPINVVTSYGFNPKTNEIDKNYFYIQWLFLYGYNQPYTIKIAGKVVYQGDVLNVQNAHEGDYEHITMKVNAQTGELVAIYYAAHGRNEGMWMYPPGTTGNSLKEFSVDNNGHPIVFSAHGGHGSYPKEGVYTRIYGLANDRTKKGPLWKLTKNNIYRTVRPNTFGYNPELHKDDGYNFAWIDFKNGSMGPRGVGIYKDWLGNIEKEDKPEKARNPVDVHTNYFCFGPNPDKDCINKKQKESQPPSGNVSSGMNVLIKMVQKLGIL